MTSLFREPVLTAYGWDLQPTFPTPRGETFIPTIDGKRLGKQMQAVYDLMLDGQWWTLPELAAAIGGLTTALSARIRDIKKIKGGPNEYEKRRRGEGKRGLWEYRLVV